MSQHIEITTAHNIIIRYEQAHVLARLLASFIDFVIVMLYAIIVLIMFSSVPTIIYIFIFIPVWMYHLFFEWWWEGQSPGKRLLKIKVVSLKSRSLSNEDVFMRWIFRSLDGLLSLGVLGILSIISTEKNQRLGDMMAGTSVVKLIPDRTVTLQSLDEMERIDHEVRYPGVVVYNDTDMLLVKDVINRSKSSAGASQSTVVMEELAERIASDLDAKFTGDPIRFLQQVINDYVILTR